jgi:serine/threonine protein kinase
MNEAWQCENELARFFPVSSEGHSTRNEPFSEEELNQIRAVLEHNGHKTWAKVVRTYVCLKISLALQHMDTLIQTGVKDISIPYTKENLPSELRPKERDRFLNAQRLVYTELSELEYGPSGKHLHFLSREKNQFETISVIGSGAFGRVEKVYSPLGQRYYAMKLLKRKNTFKGDQTSLESFVKELSASKKVDHRHVIKVVGSFTETQYVGIIMDTIGECNLHNFLEQEMDDDGRSLTRTFFGCLASGLIAIHNANIRHKDIKPENIIKKGNMVMYTDFGLALDHSQMDRSTTNGRPAMFTARFCAPEVAEHNERRSSSDVFSLGTVYLEMATRLNGESVSNLRGFLKSKNEYQIDDYCKNLDGVMKWTGMMKERGGLAIDKIAFGWIEKCLKLEEIERPTVHSLWEQIEEDTKVSSFPFACSACAVQHDSTASEANDSDENEENEHSVGTLLSGNATSAISTDLPSEDLKTHSEGKGLLTVTNPSTSATHHLRAQIPKHVLNQNQGGALLDLQASSSPRVKSPLTDLVPIPPLEISTVSQSRVGASGRPLAGDDDTFDKVRNLVWISSKARQLIMRRVSTAQSLLRTLYLTGRELREQRR